MKTLGILLITLMSLTAKAQTARAPFSDVLFDSYPSVKVEVNQQTYYLLSINGVRREQIFDTCEQQLGADCQDLFAENFEETMATLGMPVGDTIELGLYFMRNHAVTTETVDNTAENQELIIQNRVFRGQ